jgi:hypothetical protein
MSSVIFFCIDYNFCYPNQFSGLKDGFSHPRDFKWLLSFSLLNCENKVMVIWILLIWPFLYILHFGANILKHQLLPLVKLNLLRIGETFVCYIDKNDYMELITTLILSFWCSGKKLQQYGNDNFVLFHPFFPDLEFLAKQAISQMVHFKKRFTKQNFLSWWVQKMSSK